MVTEPQCAIQRYSTIQRYIYTTRYNVSDVSPPLSEEFGRSSSRRTVFFLILPRGGGVWGYRASRPTTEGGPVCLESYMIDTTRPQHEHVQHPSTRPETPCTGTRFPTTLPRLHPPSGVSNTKGLARTRRIALRTDTQASVPPPPYMHASKRFKQFEHSIARLPKWSATLVTAQAT